MRISTTLYTRHCTVHTVQPRSTHSRHEANMKHIYTRYVAWNQPGSDFRWPNIESMIVMIGQTPIAWQNVEYNRLFLANSSLHEWWCLLFCYLWRTSSCLLTAREEDAGPGWTMQGNHCQWTVQSCQAVMGPVLDIAHSGIFLSIDLSTIHDLIMFVLYQLSKRGIWSQTLTCPLHSSVIK